MDAAAGVADRPLTVGLGISVWIVAIWLLMGGGALREQVIRTVSALV